ncbi:hypothetical protein AB0O22_38925 [Streptomyces sp. NPDC091204]|uniref:hypothetical protein n=1 Tax=Streptomyces sp. NPDC091204 TaxID=3155299 RepID=UPI00341E5926
MIEDAASLGWVVPAPVSVPPLSPDVPEPLESGELGPALSDSLGSSSLGNVWTDVPAVDCVAAIAAVAPAEMRNALLMQETQISRGILPRVEVIMVAP